MKHDKQQDQPIVSVIMPVFNLQRYIAETMRSVLHQTYQNIELLIIDDCSTDHTIKIIQSIQDDRVRLMVNPCNLGAGQTRNIGVKAARGRFIAFLDGDDRWHQSKLEDQIQFMQHSNTAMCYSLYDVIDAQGQVVSGCGHVPATASYHKILRRNFIRTSTLIYDVEKTGGKVLFSGLRKRQDLIMFLSLLKRVGHAKLFPQVTCSYRTHGQSISAKKSALLPYQWAAYRHEEKLSLFYSAFLICAWACLAGGETFRRRLMHYVNAHGA